MLSIRQQKMLGDLVEKNDYIKMDDFKQKYGISVRTVRYDLLIIEEWLKEKNICLERNRKRGVFVPIDEKDRSFILGLLKEKPPFIEAKERVKLITKQLLEMEKVSSEQLMEDYKISRNTFLNDIQGARTWLENYRLTLVREQGFVLIKGKEKELRKAYLDLLREELTEEKIIQILFNNRTEELTGVSWSDWFKLEDIHELYEVVRQLEKQLCIEFSDSSFTALILHLLMAVERLRAGNLIKMEDSLLIELQEKSEFEIINSIVTSYFNDIFNIHPPLGEIGYITQHVLGAQREQSGSNEDKLYVQYAKQIVFEVEKRLENSLSNRSKIIEGLAIHLKPAFYRAKYQIQYENPLLDQMETMYGPIMELIKEVTHSIFEPSISFDKHEISYITLHVCSGLAQKQLPHKRKVAIVCSSGLGTSSILERKLTMSYPQITIVKKMSYKELRTQGSLSDVELVLSTMDIPFSTGVPVIHVSPLLQGEDQQRLIPYIGESRAAEQEEGRVLQVVKDITNIVNKFSTVHEKQRLTSELFSYLIGVSPTDKKGTLTEFLLPGAIKLAYETNNWKEAVELGNALLMAGGFTNEQYGERLVEMSKEANHHFIITEGVAFPHAGHETGVFQTGFSMVTLKEPIPFGGRKDPVWMIITMAAVDKHQHIPALETILDVLNDEEFILKLRTSKDSHQIWRSLREREEKAK
ncbi:transcriptional antiterminator/mannitol/fructose-specific phosphotransferase system IIA component (Ntr-type) [Evansella vedderi]|uniref:Transcriptional antiterminator/mannitol/fructose-specific phosphotransferase system IIA component (Ntr-type) n=1 Tax=Evansella vedderi TaxID=38282 RepID=A0ABT9ZQD0_9BACI|nr:BglG family transcription antiterminator [Evansella vedderi]MDQ0252927.1 transcriptional antiterminator/mannitol/fructose-specific phosphotransferase system IIA component (Ntr-type) [Evansella vedderi]